jgi:hypothetical protein
MLNYNLSKNVYPVGSSVEHDVAKKPYHINKKYIHICVCVWDMKACNNVP